MALYIPHSIFHLARLLYVRPETFGPDYVYGTMSAKKNAYKILIEIREENLGDQEIGG